VTQTSEAVGWYFRRGDVLLGPLTTAELLRLVERGHLSLAGEVWQEWRRGQERWLLPARVVRAVGVPRRFSGERSSPD
jgi:hypothetical protein